MRTISPRFYGLLVYFSAEGEDYLLSHSFVELRYDPVPVNVTLLNNGSGGEGTQFIDVTLVQDISFSPIEEFRVLVKPTVRIIITGALSTYKDVID